MSAEYSLTEALALVQAGQRLPLFRLRFYHRYQPEEQIDLAAAQQECLSYIQHHFQSIGLHVTIEDIKQQQAIIARESDEGVTICPVLYHFVTVHINRLSWFIWQIKRLGQRLHLKISSI